MNAISWAIDLFLHLDKHLGAAIAEYGPWIYLLLFLIIFLETGLVVTPFLPGDSLLFAAGAFAAPAAEGGARLDVWLIAGLLMVAAIIGDTVNYWIGRKVGPKIFARENVRFLNKKHLDKTHAFYEKHGGKTIILARFMPIIRTFAPFVAGIGQMSYGRFIAYNIVGGVAWVSLCVSAGYFFGNIPVVQKNFSLVIIAIVLISVMPAVIEIFREWRKGRRERSRAEAG